MSDPAVEAVQRLRWDSQAPAVSRIAALAAAREMAKPIRGVVEEIDSAMGNDAAVEYVLSKIRPLIYSDEELGL